MFNSNSSCREQQTLRSLRLVLSICVPRERLCMKEKYCTPICSIMYYEGCHLANSIYTGYFEVILWMFKLYCRIQNWEFMLRFSFVIFSLMILTLCGTWDISWCVGFQARQGEWHGSTDRSRCYVRETKERVDAPTGSPTYPTHA